MLFKYQVGQLVTCVSSKSRWRIRKVYLSATHPENSSLNRYDLLELNGDVAGWLYESQVILISELVEDGPITYR